MNTGSGIEINGLRVIESEFIPWYQFLVINGKTMYLFNIDGELLAEIPHQFGVFSLR